MISPFDMSATTQPTRLSPFDQVIEREREEEARIHTAIAALDQERNAVVEQARMKGKEELVHFKNTHLPTILQEGEQEAAQEVARIKREGASQIDRAAQNIVDVALSSDFPSLL
jgi:F0F1-type ATP synthase membrane subunit b/b'